MQATDHTHRAHLPIPIRRIDDSEQHAGQYRRWCADPLTDQSTTYLDNLLDFAESLTALLQLLRANVYIISDGGYLKNNSGLNRQPVQTMQ